MITLCFCQVANHMNSSLLSLYRKGHPDSVTSTPEMEPRETTVSVPRMPSGTGSGPLKAPARASEGGWFIDRTPAGKMGLTDEKSNHKQPGSEKEVFFWWNFSLKYLERIPAFECHISRFLWLVKGVGGVGSTWRTCSHPLSCRCF